MSMFKDYTNKIIRYIELNNRNADNHDVMRSATTSGAVSAYCDPNRMKGESQWSLKKPAL